MNEINNNPHQLTKTELRETKSKKEEFFYKKRNNIYIILDSLKCTHNIGCILRLSDSLLIKKVFICGNTIVPTNRSIKQGSRGAEKWVPWEYRENALEVAKELKKDGVEIVAVEVASNSIDYREYNPKKTVCLILGREFDGVSKELIKFADYCIHLPLLGMANSLNVSTAASVVMYDIFDKLTKNKAIQ